MNQGHGRIIELDITAPRAANEHTPFRFPIHAARGKLHEACLIDDMQPNDMSVFFQLPLHELGPKHLQHIYM